MYVSAEGQRWLKILWTLCQLRLGCFLNKFLAKWQVSWKIQEGLEPTRETMGTAYAYRWGRKPSSKKNNRKPKMHRRLKLLGHTKKEGRKGGRRRKEEREGREGGREGEKTLVLNPQEFCFCWRWTMLLKQSILPDLLYLPHFISALLQILSLLLLILFFSLIQLFYLIFFISLTHPSKFRWKNLYCLNR